MLEGLFNLVIQIFMWLVGLIGSIIIYPIQALLVTIFPNLGQAVTVINNFFSQYLFPVIGFVKELFLELSCCPRWLWSIFITFIFARWAIAPTIRAIKLVINIWKIKSGGKTE